MALYLLWDEMKSCAPVEKCLMISKRSQMHLCSVDLV
jgi:hypothetical protein